MTDIPYMFNAKNHFHNNNNNNQISCSITLFKFVTVFCGAYSVEYSSHSHADVLVSDRSPLIIGTQDFKGKCLKKGSLLSSIRGIFTSSKESLKLLMSRM
jgi:hypothetical protein